MSTELIDNIKSKVSRYHQETVNNYKYLHRNPELSFQEKNTSEFIQSKLDALGVSYRSNIGGYGILAWVEGKGISHRTIALRADMDALPITETNEIDFKSRNEGVMHACGHDTHTASLLGVVKIINEMKDSFAGRVLFIFQPGEERHPGGAKLMLEDGLFDTYKPDIIVGQHAYVDYPAGTVGFEPGVIMASADEVHVKIMGRGGHGALPNELNDTVLAASQVVASMQQIVSRRSNPFKPCVLSFGKFIADGATNIIPDIVTLAGTLRCMDEEERYKLKPIIRDLAIHTAKAYGCECDIQVYDGYPCVFNDEPTTLMMKSFAGEYLGSDSVKGLPKRMTAEDFGFYSQLYPCTFYRFGIQGERISTGLHTSTFLIDEKALQTSVGTMAYLALRYCNE